MTTWTRFAFGLALALGASAPLLGQTPSGATSARKYIDAQAGLALDDAIARAMAREPSLRADRAAVEIKEGQRQQAALRPNPAVMFDLRDEPTGTDRQTSVGIEWPLDLFRRGARVRTADREVDATRFAAVDRERILAADVRLEYGAAAAAIRDVALADELVETLRRQVAVVAARVEAGSTPPLERDLLDVELGRLEVDRAQTVGRADVAVIRLKRLLGMKADEPLTLAQTIEDLAGPGATRPVTTAPDAARPDVLEAGARVALAEARIDQAAREGRFDVSLFGSYMRMDAGFAQRGFGPDGALERVRGRFNDVSGGVRLTLPIFNRNQGLIAAAEADRTVAEARLEAAALSAESEVAAAGSGG
jgi:cobalt-zinc-cadmium efflux system outer membrane protein